MRAPPAAPWRPQGSMCRMLHFECNPLASLPAVQSAADFASPLDRPLRPPTSSSRAEYRVATRTATRGTAQNRNAAATTLPRSRRIGTRGLGGPNSGAMRISMLLGPRELAANEGKAAQPGTKKQQSSRLRRGTGTAACARAASAWQADGSRHRRNAGVARKNDIGEAGSVDRAFEALEHVIRCLQN